MSAPILATKLHIPLRRANAIRRPRLVERLNQGLQRKLTLVSAPAGFGKTTLVTEWVAAGPKRVGWLSLDERDGDPARFWPHFIAALQSVAPDLGTGPAAALQSTQPPAAELMLTALLNEIASVPDVLILVLDDYHLADSIDVSQALAFLIERQPPHMHLVIATREDPGLPLARLRGRDELVELRAQDLRFTESEAAGFLNQTMGLRLSPGDLSALETRTEGWIAGLQLAALSMQGVQDTAAFLHAFTGSHRFVLDYLLEEVLYKQPATIQSFLLRTSMLERMCGPLCDDVLPNSSISGQEALEYLERANLFVVPLDNERRWYRYHPLFRDLLRKRLTHTVAPEEMARVHVRASAWLEAQGDRAEAFRHALAAGEAGRAARLAESAWQAMDESFQTGSWLGWVNQLPPEVIRVRPVLCTQIGLAHMDAGNVEASEASLRAAEQSLRLPADEIVVVEIGLFQTLPARIAFARAYNAQSQHRYSEAARYAQAALDLVPAGDDFMRAQVSTILSGTHLANGDLEKASRLIGDWITASQQAGNYHFAIAGAFGKADILAAQGRLREAVQTYQQALELAAAHKAEQLTAHHHLGLGMLYHEMGEADRAAQHVRESFELGQQTQIADWAYRKSLAQAELKESEDDWDSALALLDEAQRYYVRVPIPNLRPLEARRAAIYLKQGRLSKAQEWARESGLSLRDAPDYVHEFERLVLVRIALAELQSAQNEPLWRESLGLLDRHLTLAEIQNRLRSQIEILIVQALVYRAAREASSARGSLEQALALAEPEGYLRLFAAEGRPLMELLAGLNTGHLKTYAAEIAKISAQPRRIHPARTAPQPLVEPLSEREMEVLRLLARGLSNHEITQKLFVALSTVKGHNLRIFAKLQAKSRSEAVARARELGLL